ncbi:MAG TPA: GtrA family protein, partial [Patescibacteria group bacterium]|nr:GtrA family protein [Patescibacteria group bacterium]
MSKKDYFLSFLAGLLIGLLLLPIIKAAKPDLYNQFSLYVIILFFLGAPFGLTVFHVISRKIAIFWQLGKFAVTGFLNFCVDLGILSLLTFIFKDYFNIDAKKTAIAGLTFITFYSLYKTASFVIANINSYYWNKYWTFEQNVEKKSEFFQFFIVSLVGLIVNVFFASIIFKFVSPMAGLNSDQWGLIGAVVGSAAGLAWNFIGYKFIVF